MSGKVLGWMGAYPMAGGGQGRLEAAASCTGSEPQRLPHAALNVRFLHVLNRCRPAMTPMGTLPLTHDPLGGKSHPPCGNHILPSVGPFTEAPGAWRHRRPHPMLPVVVSPGKFCLTSKNCDSPNGKWRPQHLPPGAVPHLRGRGSKLESTWKSFKEEKSRPLRAATQLRLVTSLYLANHHTLGPTKLLLQPHPRFSLGRKLGA